MVIITDCIREEQIQWFLALRHEEWHVVGFSIKSERNECDDNTKAQKKGPLISKDWR